MMSKAASDRNPSSPQSFLVVYWIDREELEMVVQAKSALAAGERVMERFGAERIVDIMPVDW